MKSIADRPFLLGAFLLVTTAFIATLPVLFSEVRNGTQVVVADPSAEEVLVNMTEKGFEPRNLKIRKGQTVVFASETGRHFWPASDIHPYHYIYSAFDPRRPLAPDERWSFTFDEPGVWDYHDHLASDITGTIIVEEGGQQHLPAAERSLSEPCREAESDNIYACWDFRLKETLAASGLDAAFDEMQRMHSEDKKFPYNCHVLAHDLGRMAFSRYGDNPPISEKTAYCNSGFYHGYMEGYFTTPRRAEEVRAFCQSLGRKYGVRHAEAEPQCFHGIGHGMMEHVLRTRPDMWQQPSALSDEVVSFCATAVPEDEGSVRFRCASGAYSVLFDWLRFQGEEYTPFFPVKNPFTFCDSQTREWGRQGCVWELAKRDAFIVGYEGADIATMLRRLGTLAPLLRSRAEAVSVIESYIGKAGKFWVWEQDDAQLVSLCRDNIFDESLHSTCIGGVAAGMFAAGQPDNQANRTIQFCKLGLLTNDERDQCSLRLLGYIQGYYVGTDEFNRTCDIFLRTPELLEQTRAYCEQSGHTSSIQQERHHPFAGARKLLPELLPSLEL